MTHLQTTVRRIALACSAALVIAQPFAQAQAQAFPSKPNTLVVPFPAGNASDVAMRASTTSRRPPHRPGSRKSHDQTW